MKKKSLFYLMIGIFGIVLIVSAIVLDGRVSERDVKTKKLHKTKNEG